MPLEVVGFVDVGIGLAEVAEAGPHLDVLRNHITWVELDKDLGNLCHCVACGIDAAHISVIECDRGLKLLVGRLLVGEEEVEIESLERMHYCVGGPSPRLDVVGKGCSLDFAAVLEVQSRVVVRLGDVREQRCEAQP